MTQQRKQPIKWPSFRNFPFDLFYILARFIFQVLWRQHYYRQSPVLIYLPMFTTLHLFVSHEQTFLLLLFFFVCVCSCVKRINKASRRPWNSDIRIDKIVTNDIKMRGLNTEKILKRTWSTLQNAERPSLKFRLLTCPPSPTKRPFIKAFMMMKFSKLSCIQGACVFISLCLSRQFALCIFLGVR